MTDALKSHLSLEPFVSEENKRRRPISGTPLKSLKPQNKILSSQYSNGKKLEIASTKKRGSHEFFFHYLVLGGLSWNTKKFRQIVGESLTYVRDLHLRDTRTEKHWQDKAVIAKRLCRSKKQSFFPTESPSERNTRP